MEVIMNNIVELLKGTTWSLRSFESLDKNEEIYFPLGDDAKGYIVFDHTGLFSVQIMANRRDEPLSVDTLSSYRTQVEKQMGINGYHAYSGHFSLDEDKAIMTTSVELSLIQDYVGSKQKRSVRIDGDLLYLSNINHPERKLVWERKS